MALFLVSIMVLFLGKRSYPNIFKFNLKAFLLLALIVTAPAMASIIASYLTYGFIIPLPISSLFKALSYFNVMWEDLVFVLPSLLLAHHNKSSFVRYSVIVLSSIVFGLGHLYIDLEWAIMCVGLVFMSYAIAKRYGIITTIAIHILFDIAQYISAAVTVGYLI